MMIMILAILWLVFGIMAGAMMLYVDADKRQTLGVTFSAEHAKDPGTRKLVRRFRTECWLVLILSVAASLLILLPAWGNFTEFWMLILLAANVIANWVVFQRAQTRLTRWKKQNGWTYRRAGVMNVDLNVVREKGASRLSTALVWVFLALSLIPTALVLLDPRAGAVYPVGFSLIGPLCQLAIILVHYSMQKRHIPALSQDSAVNQACARAEHQVDGAATAAGALGMLLFWLLLNVAILWARSGVLMIVAIAVMAAVTLGAAAWQQRRIRELEDAFFGPELEAGKEDTEPAGTWKWGCYCDPRDPRLFVPKRVAGMGWTINIGRPAGRAVYFGTLAGLAVLILVVVGVTVVGNGKSYGVTASGAELSIDAPMYDMQVDRAQVVSVSLAGSLPDGIRTNGYGGIHQSYGYFSLDGYGSCKLYVFNDVKEYIVIRLQNAKTGYVILNEPTQEATEELYQTVRQWANG